MRKPSQARRAAVSVPKAAPETVLASRKIAGKCLTRMRTRPRRRDTVCSGTSCLKATRKEAWIAMPPDMAVELWGLCQSCGCRVRVFVSGWDLRETGVARDHEERDVRQEREEVGHDADEGNELCVLGGAPGALEVAATVEEGDAGYEQAEDVLLGEGGGDEGPRVGDGEAGHDGQVGGVVLPAGDGGGAVDFPGAVAGGGVEEREDDEGDEEGAGQRRDVDAWCH